MRTIHEQDRLSFSDLVSFVLVGITLLLAASCAVLVLTSMW